MNPRRRALFFPLAFIAVASAPAQHAADCARRQNHRHSQRHKDGGSRTPLSPSTPRLVPSGPTFCSLAFQHGDIAGEPLLGF